MPRLTRDLGLTCPLEVAVAAASDPGLLGRFFRSVAVTADGWPDPGAGSADLPPGHGEGPDVQVDLGPEPPATPARLPFRTDADAILRRAVTDRFEEHLARGLEACVAGVRQRAGARA